MNVDALVAERCAAIDAYIASVWSGVRQSEEVAQRWIAAGRELNAALVGQ